MFERIRKKGFEVLAVHHAEAILRHDLSAAAEELEKVLLDIEVPVDELVHGGGGEGELTQRIRRALADEWGWKKHNFGLLSQFRNHSTMLAQGLSGSEQR